MTHERCRTIHKYFLRTTDRQVVHVAPEFNPLSVQCQDGRVCMWAEVEASTALRSPRVIGIFGTGNPISGDPGKYIGTVQTPNGFVWHVYDQGDMK